MDLQAVRIALLSVVILTPLLTAVLIFIQSKQNERIIANLARFGISIGVVFQLLSVVAYAFTGSTIEFTRHLTFFHHEFDFALQVNTLAVVFGSLTLFCCFTVVHFSKRYLHKEPGFRKFFGLLFVLTEGMLLLSYSDNLLTFFVGWEFIGIASFLLIAFYREQAVSVRNALKVFSVYKVGDLGLIFRNAVVPIPCG